VKSFIISALLFIVSLCGQAPAFATIIISFESGKKIELKQTYKAEGTEYFIANELFGSLGIEPTWYPVKSKLSFKMGGHIVSLSLGARHVIVDGELLCLPSTPLLIDSSLALPLQFANIVLAELLEERVSVTYIEDRTISYDNWHFDGALNDFLPPRKIQIAQRGPDREFILVLDAGHGGDDSGAVSADGFPEKHVVLKVALLIEQLLSDTDNLHIHMTRRGDYYITLKQRSEKANQLDADLFISIHANAARRKTAIGVETFFLSANATDDSARRTAQFENSVFEREETFLGLEDELKGILFDLSRSEHLRESEALAHDVQAGLIATLNTENRGVKQAPFYVLMGANMPAVLIEIGFMSNREEAAKLQDDAYLNEIAESIATVLVDHIYRTRRKESVH
jgi:N-acetylmuramoyl-L-alanine amidase